jgi:ubiquinone/menaquinone biosynthesis C-methylase UbiE
VSGPLTPEERARETERQRERYAEEARTYDRGARLQERVMFGRGHREWVIGRARGRTLEVAIGTGLNIPLYAPDVDLVAVDLTPEMMAHARGRATALGRDVTFLEADAQALPFGDDTFDTVVATYAMCSVPDLPLTIREMRRVLKPGGRLVLLDHVRSTCRPLLWLQRVRERRRAGSAEELTRRPLEDVEAAGLEIDESERFRAGVVERLAAIKPSRAAGP